MSSILFLGRKVIDMDSKKKEMICMDSGSKIGVIVLFTVYSLVINTIYPLTLTITMPVIPLI